MREAGAGPWDRFSNLSQELQSCPAAPAVEREGDGLRHFTHTAGCPEAYVRSRREMDILLRGQRPATVNLSSSQKDQGPETLVSGRCLGPRLRSLLRHFLGQLPGVPLLLEGE